MRNYILKYGLLGGSVSIGLGLINWFTISQYFGPGISQAVGYLSIILSLMCIPLGIQYYRDKLNNGTITFGKGFNIGLGIAFIASLVVFFYGILFFVFAGDSFDKWNKKGLSEAEINDLQLRIAQTPEFVLTPWFQGLVLSLSVLMIGLIINLLSSLILKR